MSAVDIVSMSSDRGLIASVGRFCHFDARLGNRHLHFQLTTFNWQLIEDCVIEDRPIEDR
jgi:hypothetical protein